MYCKGSTLFKHTNDLVNPFTISIEDKPVHASLLVPSHTNPIYELRLRTHGHQSSEEPAIARAALVDVRRRSPIDEKLRVIKDIIDTLDPRRSIDFLDSLESI